MSDFIFRLVLAVSFFSLGWAMSWRANRWAIRRRLERYGKMSGMEEKDISTIQWLVAP